MIDRLKFPMRAGAWALIVVLFLGGVFFAPHFLTYSDFPQKSQAVILFLGPDEAARRKEAVRLMEEGFADILIIPASRLVYKKRGGALEVKRIDFHETPGAVSSPAPSSFFFQEGKRTGGDSDDDLRYYPGYWENTHVEICRAGRMMEILGIEKAILVSSPCHMRRIRLIARHVFGKSSGNGTDRSQDGDICPGKTAQNALAFVPTRYLRKPGPFWFLEPNHRKDIPLEYVKIAWFLLYSSFSLKN